MTETYENQAGTLVIRQSLEGACSESSGHLAWGDYDGDGDLDLVVAGTGVAGAIARAYKNDGAGHLAPDPAQVLTGVGYASVAWGDYDGDGDLDLLIQGHDGTVARTILYRNHPQGTLSPDPSHTLTGLYAGSADWGDWDGDGDLDLVVTGHDGTNRRTIFYKNHPLGTLTNDGNHGLPGLVFSDTAWGDCDNDGDLDLAITGEDGTNRYACVYANDGAGVFTRVGANLAVLYRSSCGWGDYDNDGDLDVGFIGSVGSGGHQTLVFQNTGAGFSQAFSFYGIYEGSVSWADVDGDGDLDFFVTGYDWYTAYASLYRNIGGLPNHGPAAPASLQYTPDWARGGLALRWGGPADDKTATPGLYYCVRIGVTSGGNEVLSGTYGTPLMGNVGQGTSAFVKAPHGRYFWSVRAIDSVLAASAWSAEGTCSHYPGDTDNDGDVDLTDFAAFQSCFNGPNQTLPAPGCNIVDFDADNDCDLSDFATFQACFNGPNQPPPAGC